MKNQMQVERGIIELHDVIAGKAKQIINTSDPLDKESADTSDLLICLLRACGMRKVAAYSARYSAPFPDAAEIERIRRQIYESFGAPGDWGYGTGIGKALREIYEC